MRPIAFLIALTFAAVASAGVSLPLNGACRTGRFFPVVVDSVDRITLTADGCLPVDVTADHHRMTVPVLVTGSPGVLRSAGVSLPLHLIGDDEVLVATTDPSISFAAMFPGRRVTPIRLDPTDPLPGPTVAWETLDAVCLDPATVPRLTDQARSTLLAAGVQIFCDGPNPPDTRWPWTRKDRWWVLVFHPSGPVDLIVDSDVYSPVSSWSPGRPATVRHTIVFSGVLITLTTVAICLWRSRWRVPTATVGLLLAAGAVILWRHTLNPTADGGGEVIVVGGPLVQRDSWLFQRGLDTGTVGLSFRGWTHPIFSSPSAMKSSGLSMSVTPTTVSFITITNPDRLLAIVHREVGPGSMPKVANATNSPMQDLARGSYTASGDRIAGDGPAAPGRWATSVVIRSK